MLAPALARANEDIPSGFKVDRYREVWQRNPFFFAVPAATQNGPTPFDKLVLVSWLRDGPKTIVFIQNTDTSEIQKITSEPNGNKLRLVEVHKSIDPSRGDVVLSNGTEEGAVRFRMDIPPPTANTTASQGSAAGVAIPPPAQAIAPVAASGIPIHPGMTRQLQQNTLLQQQAANIRAAQTQQGAALPVSSQSAAPAAAFQPRARQRMIPKVAPNGQPPAAVAPVSPPAPAQ